MPRRWPTSAATPPVLEEAEQSVLDRRKQVVDGEQAQAQRRADQIEYQAAESERAADMLAAARRNLEEG